MRDVEPFSVVIFLVAAALIVAVLSNRLSDRIRIPAPALFLIAAAVASDVFPALGAIPLEIDERIVTVALIFILFDGGMHMGWKRFRSASGSIVWIGVAGTAVTAGAVAFAAHALFGFDWRTALLLGAALSPTDPAVVFSVLGKREIAGRSGTILEGESGANDPVGIALMASLLGASGAGFGAVAAGAGNFALQMAVGAAVGGLGGYALVKLMRRVALPNESLHSVRTIACAAFIYAAATLLHGSGFLAVFLAGIIVGDARAPYKREIERFVSGFASISEIVAFAVLGLSVSLRELLVSGALWTGLALAALLILVVRPVLVGALLWPVRLHRGERLFVLWSGLKGAVPILLGMFILGSGTAKGSTVYSIIFVVVLVSVVLQGSLVPAFAGLFRVPMRQVQLEPWAFGLRFRNEPHGLHDYVIAPGSPADGCTIAELSLGESGWISMVRRHGQLVQVRGTTTLQAGDTVLALSEPEGGLADLFKCPR
ncbi:cation:proton antiporter [Paenarthrobacter sp. Z7-10]|uniref:cation:proton antiporter domain-containing protein n=1 Tax=Paenarthrobacter sp. Z7-10 TaxID=2787635 RepID=UPI0022A9EAAB|nr:cation:proton antiporter [Paenarthrobacter sp. Z7-10]MCZ2402182.1 cation:proton antiporter [Paenarthrobacter sp. Z7-10]